MHRVLFCLRCRFIGGCYIFKPGRPNGLHPYCTGRACIFDAFPTQALVYWGNHPCRGKNGDELHIPCYLQVLGVKLCTAKLCLENQNKTYRDQSYPKAFPQINKRESNFPCSLAQITPDNKQRFNTHSVSLARA